MILQVESFIKSKGYRYLAGTVNVGFAYDKQGKTVLIFENTVTVYTSDDNGDTHESRVILYDGIDIEKTLTPYV